MPANSETQAKETTPNTEAYSAAHRRSLLEELVETGRYATQAQLVEALQTHGISATQSSISRDIREIGLTKEGGVYRLSPMRYAGSVPAAVWRLISSVKHAGDHMLVIRSAPATAQAIAAGLDEVAWPGLLGTIAGDDTVFVAVESGQAANEITKRLHAIANL